MVCSSDGGSLPQLLRPHHDCHRPVPGALKEMMILKLEFEEGIEMTKYWMGDRNVAQEMEFSFSATL